MYQSSQTPLWFSLFIFPALGLLFAGCQPAKPVEKVGQQAGTGESVAAPNEATAKAELADGGDKDASPDRTTVGQLWPSQTPSGTPWELPPSPGAPTANETVQSGWIVPDEPFSTTPSAGGQSQPVESPRLPSSLPGVSPRPETASATQDEAGPLPNPLRGNQVPTAGDATIPQVMPNAPSSPLPAASDTQATPPRVATSKTSDRRLERPPFDPIKENGQFFVGWTKPTVALVFTGNQDGYFEPCGCAGKERMKGGLSRRHTMIEQLRADGWPLVVMDLGGLIKGFGKQTEVKFQITVDALRRIGYHAINLGRNDLRLPAPLLLSVIAPSSGTESEFVSANVALFDFDTDQWTSRFRVVEAGGKRVGVTAILGKSYQEEIRNPDLSFADPAEALAKVVPQLKQQADILVLLAYAARDEAIALVREFPEFAVVAISDGPAEPPGAPQFVPDTQTMLVFVGEKGMAAAVVGIYERNNPPMAYQRVILDSRYPDSPAMKEMMATYQAQLQALGLEGLEIRPAPHPRREVQGEFVGSEKCAACHEESYRVWKRSGHSRAWETLVRLDPPRNFDPECISCHVTGWHPTRYFPYLSGFLSEQKTPHLINVGCESCHGPGGEHVAAEMGSDLERQRRAAEAMIVTKEQAESSEAHSCRNCHDLDNSPDFDFSTYWPLVEHYEKE